MALDFEDILKDLKQKGVIDKSFTEVSLLSEHGNSRVGVISKNGEKTFVIKIHNAVHIRAESTFLLEYAKNPHTPQLLFVDPEGKYLLYTYIDGQSSDMSVSKGQWLQALIEKYINHYKFYPDSEIWGYLDDSCPTYADVLKSDIQYWSQARSVLTKEDEVLALTLSEEVGPKYKGQKYLVHGDPSIRNSLFKNGQLVAVIDPYPLIAPKIYDVLFAFCSDPRDLDLEVLRSVIDNLHGWDGDETVLKKHLLVHLYCRIGIAVKHSPQTVSEYVQAWKARKKFFKGIPQDVV